MERNRNDTILDLLNKPNTIYNFSVFAMLFLNKVKVVIIVIVFTIIGVIDYVKRKLNK